jgi:hypothetical protein
MVRRRTIDIERKCNISTNLEVRLVLREDDEVKWNIELLA